MYTTSDDAAGEAANGTRSKLESSAVLQLLVASETSDEKEPLRRNCGGSALGGAGTAAISSRLDVIEKFEGLRL